MVSASTFPNLDADLYVPARLEGVLGSRSWDGTPWRCRAAGPQRRQGFGLAF